jgi:glycosyltransferase involved in cell wall biosynthesis
LAGKSEIKGKLPREKEKMQPDISIVIPARNEAGRIAQCLHSLRNQSLAPDRYEIIVVDDGSDDDSAGVAQRNGARVIRQPKYGAAVARNRGIAEARGDIILFTDADCIAEEHWIERLGSPLMQAAIQGTVGRIVSRQRHWLARLIQAELDERYMRMEQHQLIDFINSGNCGFKRAILEENHFDGSFAWIEDLELSFRLARSGKQMIFIQHAIVEHAHPQDLWVYLKRKFRYASFAFLLYRRYPDKILSDSRTPSYLRWQLMLVALAIVAMPFAVVWTQFLLIGFIGFAGAMALSYSFCRRAARDSIALGCIAPFFALLGNLSFAAGTVKGLLLGKEPRRPPKRG